MDALALTPAPTDGLADQDDDLYRIVGIVERVTFHDPATGYSVLRLRAHEHPRPVTLVGTTDTVVAGARVRARGRWSRHPRYGMQFVAERAEISPPEFAGALQTYVGGGLADGIGPEHARRLVEAFGPQVLDVAEREPWRLREVRGVGPKRAAALCDAALHGAPVSTPSAPTASRGRRAGAGGSRT